AWVGCLHCYNSGRLVGRWYNLTDPDDLAVIEGDDDDSGATSLLQSVHAPHNPTGQCEELWVMDHENLPIEGECSPAELVKIAELHDEVTTHDPDGWAAYCAYVLDQYGG